jgi:hypothetical protein
METVKNIISLILVLVGLSVGQTAKFFLPVPVESSSGRPIPNQTVVMYPTGTTSNGVTLTWLDAGRYYYTDTTAVPAGDYDIYINDILYQTNTAIRYTTDVLSSIVGISRSTATHVGNNNIVNVKDFGALGDSTTSDTAAFKDAFDAASAYGAMVYIPSGTYNVADMPSAIDIDSSIVVLGDGKPTLLGDDYDDVLFKFSNRTSISGIKFKTMGTPINFEDAGSAADGHTGSYLLVEDCVFEDIGRLPIDAALGGGGEDDTHIVDHITVQNSVFSECRAGLHHQAIPVLAINVLNNVFDNCDRLSTDTHLTTSDILSMIEVGEDLTKAQKMRMKVNISGNTLRNIENYRSYRVNGILTYGATLTVFNNKLDWLLSHIDNAEYASVGMHIRGVGSARITNNDMLNCSGAGAFFFKGETDDSSKIFIENNRIYNTGAYVDSINAISSKGIYGLSLGDNPTGPAIEIRDNSFRNMEQAAIHTDIDTRTDFIITGNEMDTCGTAIWLNNGAENVMVQGNRVKNSSSFFRFDGDQGDNATGTISIIGNTVALRDSGGQDGIFISTIPRYTYIADNFIISNVDTANVGSYGTYGYTSFLDIRSTNGYYTTTTDSKAKLYIKNNVGMGMLYKNSGSNAINVQGYFDVIDVSNNHFEWFDVFFRESDSSHTVIIKDNVLLNAYSALDATDNIQFDTSIPDVLTIKNNVGPEIETENEGIAYIVNNDSVIVNHGLLALDDNAMSAATPVRYFSVVGDDPVKLAVRNVTATQFTIKCDSTYGVGDSLNIYWKANINFED